MQEDRYLGNYQARWYRSVVGVGGTGEDTDPQTQWVETEITRMHLKSAIARVRKTAGGLQVLGFVLNDGTATEIGGSARSTTARGRRRRSIPPTPSIPGSCSRYRWDGATPGEHTLVSRVTDAEGVVQPTAADLSRKKTFLQDNAQFPRKVMIG